MVKKWLPGTPITENSMAEAIFLEKRYWENMRDAIATGIDKAL
jgi:hypothetical protein